MLMDDTQIESYSKKRIRWGSIGFFIALALTAAIGIPIYVHFSGWRRADLVLFAVYAFLTTLGVTAGYHRFYSHRAFKANPVLQFLFLFFGAGAVQQPALKWAALHRQHHRYTDTARDPYNIKQGFFHAHMGWLLFHKYAVDYEGVKDLEESALVRNQQKYFQVWAFTSGVAVPLLIGALYGSVIGGFLFGVCLRLSVVYQSTFFINSVAHSFGTHKFDTQTSARDSWICAVLTNGEGYHNFHHRFPSDYRNGYKWYHWDPTKWFIWAASKARVTTDLRRTPAQQIADLS